jgi:hypothetical protein
VVNKLAQIEGEPDPHYVCITSGFEAGKVYQLFYTSGSAL